MLKDRFKDITVVTILIAYLYMCGSLSMLGFWSTFDIDVSNFVSISDIPKNFVYPFIITGIFYIIIAIMQTIIIGDTHKIAKKIKKYNNDMEELKTSFPEEKENLEKKKIGFFSRKNYVIDLNSIILFYCAFVYYYYRGNEYSQIYWGLTLFILYVLLSIKFNTTDYIKQRIPNLVNRTILSTILFAFPISCFGVAKAKSIDVYHNKDIKYIKIINNKAIQPIAENKVSKLLGFLGDKLIVCSLDNKSVFIYNVDDIEYVQLDTAPGLK